MSRFHFRNDRFHCLDAEFLYTIYENTNNREDIASREISNFALNGFNAVIRSPEYRNIKWNKRTLAGDTVSDMIYHFDVTELIPYAYERNSQVEGTHDYNPFNNETN